MAEEKRDILDDLIDIQADWRALSNPLGDIANELTDAATGQRKVFNPADYKERPRVSPTRCLRSSGLGDGVCARCADVCPTNAVDLSGKQVKLTEDCRKCGLCASVCPTEAISCVSNSQRRLYDRIATAASAYRQCYVTCTRAIKRLPKGNEVVLACVGALSADLWFSLLTDYDNISVYLPLGVCDRCRTTTGEEFYSDAIATAEEWSQGTVGLEVDNKALDHEFTRAYKRSQFVSGAITSAERMVSRRNPALAGAQAVAKKMQDHAKQLDRLTKQVEDAVGAKTTNNRKRTLTGKRKLLMGALQHDPGLAESVKLEHAECDAATCTMCGDCVKVCTLHALDLNEHGRVIVEPQYCVGCGACVRECPEGSLTLVPTDAAELVVPDEMTAQVRKQKAAAKEQANQLMEKGKQQLKRAGDALEKLDS